MLPVPVPQHAGTALVLGCSGKGPRSSICCRCLDLGEGNLQGGTGALCV